MNYLIKTDLDTLSGSIRLESSKSISNRVLIIKALCKKDFEIGRLSNAQDTVTLSKLLQSSDEELNVGHAGTTMRFLTTYFAIQEDREVILTGSQRMKQRPIHVLVDALRKMGADIEYLEKDGYPPIKIKGKKIKGGKYSINAGVSSQYISALLMIAPLLQDGLELYLEGTQVSMPYIEMTLDIMQYFGVRSEKLENKNVIRVSTQEYKAKDIEIEADWSAASYWYEIASFCKNVDFTIEGLFEESLQGDAVIKEIMEANFGVKTEYIKEGIHLSRIPRAASGFSFDFIRCPDLAQTIAITCAGTGKPGTFLGLETLKIKETDRTAALQNELRKFGVEFSDHKNVWKISGQAIPSEQPVETYEDHRMAMAFSPLAIPLGQVIISEPEVVKKSYPFFWEDLRKVGFMVTET